MNEVLKALRAELEIIKDSSNEGIPEEDAKLIESFERVIGYLSDCNE